MRCFVLAPFENFKIRGILAILFAFAGTLVAFPQSVTVFEDVAVSLVGDSFYADPIVLANGLRVVASRKDLFIESIHIFYSVLCKLTGINELFFILD